MLITTSQAIFVKPFCFVCLLIFSQKLILNNALLYNSNDLITVENLGNRYLVTTAHDVLVSVRCQFYFILLIFLLRFDYRGDSFTNFPFIRLVQCCCSGEKNKGTQVRFHDVKFLITADQFHSVKIFTLNFTE